MEWQRRMSSIWWHWLSITAARRPALLRCATLQYNSYLAGLHNIHIQLLIGNSFPFPKPKGSASMLFATHLLCSYSRVMCSVRRWRVPSWPHSQTRWAFRAVSVCRSQFTTCSLCSPTLLRTTFSCLPQRFFSNFYICSVVHECLPANQLTCQSTFTCTRSIHIVYQSILTLNAGASILCGRLSSAGSVLRWPFP